MFYNSIETMSCKSEIHNELIDSGEVHCPFCDQQISSVNKNVDVLCCDNKEIITNEGIIVCRNCGQVHGYDFVSEYIELYENLYSIRRKSIYQRKYHIEKVLSDFQLSYNYKEYILKEFKKCEKAILEIVKGRKRYPRINFILYKIFQHEYDKQNMEKCINYISKKTLTQYQLLWKDTVFIRINAALD